MVLAERRSDGGTAGTGGLDRRRQLVVVGAAPDGMGSDGWVDHVLIAVLVGEAME